MLAGIEKLKMWEKRMGKKTRRSRLQLICTLTLQVIGSERCSTSTFADRAAATQAASLARL
jgi:hypothetical protein